MLKMNLVKRLLDLIKINNNIKIDDELLYTSLNIISGYDKITDPWSFDSKYLKLTCEVRGYLDKYEYLNKKMTNIVNRLINDNISFDNEEIKYQYAEEIFGQKIIRFD